jgi:hypothetical protein
MIPTEQQEAETLAAWLRVHGIPFTHVPNETGHTMEAKRRAIRMKRAGVSKGFPDYLVFKDGKSYAIELKRRQGGRATPEQREWLTVLSRHGFESAICHGAGEAIDFLEGRA